MNEEQEGRGEARQAVFSFSALSLSLSPPSLTSHHPFVFLLSSRVVFIRLVSTVTSSYNHTYPPPFFFLFLLLLLVILLLPLVFSSSLHCRYSLLALNDCQDSHEEASKYVVFSALVFYLFIVIINMEWFCWIPFLVYLSFCSLENVFAVSLAIMLSFRVYLMC